MFKRYLTSYSHIQQLHQNIIYMNNMINKWVPIQSLNQVYSLQLFVLKVPKAIASTIDGEARYVFNQPYEGGKW